MLRWRSTAAQPTAAVSQPWGRLDAAGRAAARPSDLTHEVENQTEPLEGHNAFEVDPTLREALRAGGGEWAAPMMTALGAQVGAASWQAEARAANAHVPRHVSHDRSGRRVDVVEYHPSYHNLMDLAVSAGIASFAWEKEHAGRPGAMTARCGPLYLCLYSVLHPIPTAL